MEHKSDNDDVGISHEVRCGISAEVVGWAVGGKVNRHALAHVRAIAIVSPVGGIRKEKASEVCVKYGRAA